MTMSATPPTPDNIRREIVRRWQQHLFHSLAGRPDSARCELEAIDKLLDKLPQPTGGMNGQ